MREHAMKKINNLPFNFRKYTWVSCRKIDGEWYFLRGWMSNQIDRAMRFYENMGGEIFCAVEVERA